MISVLDNLERLSSDNTDESGRVPSTGDQMPVGVLLATDLIAAAIALPVALLVLSLTSPAQQNSLSDFWKNIESSATFPVAIVIGLAMAGFYRSSRRARYESSFSELKELVIALCAGCVLSIAFSLLLHLIFSIAEGDSTQPLLASIVAVAFITIGHGIRAHPVVTCILGS